MAKSFWCLMPICGAKTVSYKSLYNIFFILMCLILLICWTENCSTLWAAWAYLIFHFYSNRILSPSISIGGHGIVPLFTIMEYYFVLVSYFDSKTLRLYLLCFLNDLAFVLCVIYAFFAEMDWQGLSKSLIFICLHHGIKNRLHIYKLIFALSYSQSKNSFLLTF